MYTPRNTAPLGNPRTPIKKDKFYKRKWFKIAAPFILIILLVGGFFTWKTGNVLNKISNGGMLSTLVHNIPGVKDELKGEADGRINVLLMGMRGADDPNGGNLADTIMLVSIEPAQKKVAMISIPRDLYVTVPGTQDKQKINAVHAYGEQDGKKQGLADMEKIVSDVTGVPVQYAVSINFAGFTKLVDSLGGVEVTLNSPFEESLQFNEEHVCDGNVFTVPTGNYQTKTKRDKRTGIKKVTARYPLCTNPDKECGGDFKLPAGKQTLNGDQALCLARARKSSSDFERAKRQQLIIQSIKDKLVSIGTVTDFSKVNGLLDSLGDNVRSDMAPWEMQRFYEIYKQMPDPEIHQRVLEDSEEGLLYFPGEGAAGYILLPRGDNYDKIHDLVQNIFTKPEQSDIKPK